MNSWGEYSRSRLPRLIIDSDPDNIPESVRKDSENRVTTTEDEPKAKTTIPTVTQTCCVRKEKLKLTDIQQTIRLQTISSQ